MKRSILMLVVLIVGLSMNAQDRRLKGNGQVFWQEQFNWENPQDEKGWTAPAGWIIEDLSEDDNGFVWVWTKDSMQGPFARRDGGYILNSSTRDNGFLAIDLDHLNAGRSYTDMLYVNSTITLPVMNFSTHPSVILSLEQMFKYFNSPRMVIEVSNDRGGHWAEFDLKMGTGRGVNTLNLPNNQVARYTANLSEVAAGQPEVIIRLTWSGSMLYFWMIDDLTLSEGWDYDLKMNHFQAGLIDNNPDASAGFLYMMPKTQILPIGGFQGSVVNYGDQEMTNIRYEVDIRKNGISQFREVSNILNYRYFGDPADTLDVAGSYTPAEFGHYEMVLEMKADQEDQFPENNRKSFYFHVTDSVFSRTPDEFEAHESPWRDYYQYTHEGDIMAVEFDVLADCEASSISAFISKANVDADFRFVLMEITPVPGQQPVTRELLVSGMMTVDSALLEKGWVTMPLEPDGQGEKLKAGKKYLAGVQFYTYITADNLINRKNTFWVGATKSYPDSFDKQWTFQSNSSEWQNGSSFNKMIRLNINNHDNRIDGIRDHEAALRMDPIYPNPAVSEAFLSVDLPQAGQVRLELTDLTGRLVRQFDLGNRPSGRQTLTVDLHGLMSGSYLYTLVTSGGKETKRLSIVN